MRRTRALARRVLGFDLLPPPEVADAFCEDMFAGDPVAEELVDEVLSGDGRRRGRKLLDAALESREGFAAVAAEAPDSMRRLFQEFEAVPEWVDRDLVEEGA